MKYLINLWIIGNVDPIFRFAVIRTLPASMVISFRSFQRFFSHFIVFDTGSDSSFSEKEIQKAKNIFLFYVKYMALVQSFSADVFKLGMLADLKPIYYGSQIS